MIVEAERDIFRRLDEAIHRQIIAAVREFMDSEQASLILSPLDRAQAYIPGRFAVPGAIWN